MHLIRRTRPRGRRLQLTTTEAAKQWLMAMYGEKHPMVVIWVLQVTQNAHRWHNLDELLKAKHQIPHEILPLVPWLAQKARQSYKTLITCMYHRSLVDFLWRADPHPAPQSELSPPRRALERVWVRFQNTPGDDTTRALPWAVQQETEKILRLNWGRGAVEAVREDAQRRGLPGLMITNLHRVAAWARSQRPDLRRTSLLEGLKASAMWERDQRRLPAEAQGRVVLELDNPRGWTWQAVNLGYLDEVGEVMGNCLGDPDEDYAGRIQSGASDVYVLTDTHGQPRLTAEVKHYDVEAVLEDWDHLLGSEADWWWFIDPYSEDEARESEGYLKIKRASGAEAAESILAELVKHGMSEPPGVKHFSQPQLAQVEGRSNSGLPGKYEEAVKALARRFNLNLRAHGFRYLE